VRAVSDYIEGSGVMAAARFRLHGREHPAHIPPQRTMTERPLRSDSFDVDCPPDTRSRVDVEARDLVAT